MALDDLTIKKKMEDIQDSTGSDTLKMQKDFKKKSA